MQRNCTSYPRIVTKPCCTGVARAGMDASMRDALAEVEKDRSQLSGVIVSRFDFFLVIS